MVPRLAVLLLIALPAATLAAPGTSGASIGPQTSAVDRSAYSAVHFVSQTSGSDANGDGTQSKPWASISTALAKTSDATAERRCAVLVAAGTYGGETIAMKPHVDLFGGHDPQTWQRDIHKHLTTLDGQQTRRVVVGADHARIDGFVIRGGKSNGPGGGILCHRVSPAISNNAIIDNLVVEPADYVFGLPYQVGNDGGGIACIDAAHPTITNNVIARNTTHIGNGGGIGTRNYSSPIIENNVICDNLTGVKDNDPDVKKRARSSNGAGISASHATPRLEKRMRIANNVITGNRVGGNSDAGGIYCEYDSSPVISGNYLLNNLAEDDGGGMYIMKSSEPLVIGNIFAGNRGGGLRLSKEGRARIHNNLLFGNSGGMTLVDSWALCTNNTVDGGIFYRNASLLSMKPSIFMNNILCSNGKPVALGVEATEPPVVSHCNLSGGAEGPGNFAADPKFIDDSASGALKGMIYDPQRVQTRLALSASTSQASSWAGRIVRVGDAWGVIASGSADELLVWGDLRGDSRQAATGYTIAPTYRLSPSSPCIGKGVTIPKALWGAEPEAPAMAEGAAVNVGATLPDKSAAQASMSR
jgi:parallel beta-helix repeat protein